MPDVERSQDVPSKNEPIQFPSLMDYYKFHPGTSDKTDALMPFSLTRPGDTAAVKPQAPDTVKTEKPKEPGVLPFIPGLPLDKPVTPPAGETTAKDKTETKDNPIVLPPLEIPGESPAVLAYRARQGARRAGQGVASTDVPLPPTTDRQTPPAPKPDGNVRPVDYRPNPGVPTPPGPELRPDGVPDSKPIAPRPIEIQPEDARQIPEKVEVKEQYHTKDAKEAEEIAKKSGLPLVVHIGASWCGPCKNMDRFVYPGLEKDYKGKAVFLHIDGDEAQTLGGPSGDTARKYTSGVSGYPTIKVYSNDGGNLNLKTQTSGGQSRQAMDRLLGGAGIRR